MTKLKKLTALVLSAVMLVCCFAVTASADSIYDTAKAITSGKSYSTTLYSSGDTADYKITASKKGELILDIVAQISNLRAYVYDSDGNMIKYPHEDIKSGSGISGWGGSRGYSWNNTIERFAGKLTYPVEKGTYYIRFEKRESAGTGKLTFTATAPTSAKTTSSSLNYIGVPVKVGSSFKLEAYGVAASGDKLTWTSSDTSVATINSSGTVTAKKAGTAVITAKLGSSTSKICIKVVS